MDRTRDLLKRTAASLTSLKTRAAALGVDLSKHPAQAIWIRAQLAADPNEQLVDWKTRCRAFDAERVREERAERRETRTASARARWAAEGGQRLSPDDVAAIFADAPMRAHRGACVFSCSLTEVADSDLTCSGRPTRDVLRGHRGEFQEAAGVQARLRADEGPRGCARSCSLAGVHQVRLDPTEVSLSSAEAHSFCSSRSASALAATHRAER
jgi:hypothetical protein